MPYIRKTEDEFQIWVNYGQGDEEVTAESTRREGMARLREYRENEPQYRSYMIKRRVRIEPRNAATETTTQERIAQ